MFKKTLILTAILTSITAAQPQPKPQPDPQPQPQPTRDERTKGRYEEALRARLQAEHARLAQEQQLEAINEVRFARAAVAPVKMIKLKVAYCGVGTSEVPPVLTEQLKLKKGMGLVVDFVEEKSPAQAAGLKPYDVLVKMDDQWLVNAEQLRSLVRLKKLADDAKFTVIRQGQEIAVNVELAEKEVEEPEEQAMQFKNANIEHFVAPRLIATPAQPRLTARLDLHNNPVAGAIAVVHRGDQDQLAWSDKDHTLNLTMKDGKTTHLMVTENATNKQVFAGPVETEEQRKALPPGIAEKLGQAQAGPPAGGMLRERVTRSRVLTSTDKDTLMIAKFEQGKAVHVFAFNTADGKTLFDGPTQTDEQRKTLPEAIAAQLQTLEKNQKIGGEFGAVGR